VFFLAVLARHAELPAVDGDVDLRHPCFSLDPMLGFLRRRDLFRSPVARYFSSASTPRMVSIA
jgi:hypothetical protein